jgi:ERF superfamily
VPETEAVVDAEVVPATLMAALLAVQAEAPKIIKDQANLHFKSKFASLDAVMDAVGPILARHGLVWVTLPGREEGEPVLAYKLVHAASGEELQGAMPLMLKSADPQGQGSALTYARRYSIMAVLGLVPDEDDDGNRAQKASEREQSGPPFGEPASPEVATSMRKAVAWMLDKPVNHTEVTALLGQIEQRAGGYLPMIAARAIGHVAAAARDARTAREATVTPGEGDPSQETDEERAERVLAEAAENGDA